MNIDQLRNAANKYSAVLDDLISTGICDDQTRSEEREKYFEVIAAVKEHRTATARELLIHPDAKAFDRFKSEYRQISEIMEAVIEKERILAKQMPCNLLSD